MPACQQYNYNTEIINVWNDLPQISGRVIASKIRSNPCLWFVSLNRRKMARRHSPAPWLIDWPIGGWCWFLQRNERVTYLNLSHNDFGHEGAVALGRAIGRPTPCVLSRSYCTHWGGLWCNGGASDSSSNAREFDSRPRDHQVTTLGKLFTPMSLC